MSATSPAVVLGRGFVVWCVIALAETLHGVLRSLFIAPAVGDHRAGQLGVFVGAAIILVIAWLLIRWIGARGTSQLLALGGLWLVLMLAFEIGLGRALGFSWDRILSDYDLSRGGLMLIGMGILFLSPLFAAKARGWRNSRAA